MEAHTPSTALVGVIDGVVGFRLVHNFGAAWGSFSGIGVIVLVIVSIVLCAIILAYMIYVAEEDSRCWKRWVLRSSSQEAWET